MANAGPQDLLIVSYTLLQLAQERFAGVTWHTLIADEAQAIKNAATKRSQAVFGLPPTFAWHDRYAGRKPAGRPLVDHALCQPRPARQQQALQQRFAGPIERNRDRAAQHMLKRLIAPFVLRRTKSEVLQELPPRTELVLAVARTARKPRTTKRCAARRREIDASPRKR